MHNEIVNYKLNADNFMDEVARIYADEVIHRSNDTTLYSTVHKIYHQYIEDYENIPSIIDILDEISYINMEKFNDIAQLFLQFDGTAIGMIEMRMEEMEMGNSIYTDKETILDEVAQIVISDLWDEMSGNGEEVYREEISLALSSQNLPFILDYDDDIYMKMDFLLDSGKIFLINDCQIKLFPSMDIDFLAEKVSNYEKCGHSNYMLIPIERRVEKKINTQQLEYSKGW